MTAALRKSVSLFLAGFIALTLGLALPGLALAHAVKVSSDPAENAVLSGPPAQVSATFNAPLRKLFCAMTVIGPDDKTDQWQSGDPVVSGAVISIGVKPSAPGGKYTVNYRVISEDGHPVDGSWPFTIIAAGPSSAVGAPALSQQPPASPTDGDLPMWPFVVAVVASVGAALIWTQRRRS